MQIDQETRKIVNESYNEVLGLLKDNLDVLHELSSLLLEKEVIDSAELDELVSKMREEFRPEVKKPFDITSRV